MKFKFYLACRRILSAHNGTLPFRHSEFGDAWFSFDTRNYNLKSNIKKLMCSKVQKCRSIRIQSDTFKAHSLDFYTGATFQIKGSQISS